MRNNTQWRGAPPPRRSGLPSAPLLLTLWVLGIVLMTGASPAAQQTLTPADLRVYTGRIGANSLIQGMARNADSTPLPSATVRLRNLETNQIEQVTVANLAGEFTFLTQPNIPYLVELADTFGRIVAVGDLLTMQAGEVVGQVVTLPARLPAVAGLFGDTASSILSAAASSGVTAIEPTPPPDSPSR